MKKPFGELLSRRKKEKITVGYLQKSLKKFRKRIREKEMINVKLKEPCGLCSDRGKWNKLFDYPSADVPHAEIFQCGTCGVIKNGSVRHVELENEVIQSQWVKDGFYNLPVDEIQFEEEANHAAGIFPWLESQLGISLKNLSMLEIGAGSGLRSAGATKFFW